MTQMLVATESDVVEMNSDRSSRAGCNLAARPTCPAGDRCVPGRAWCGTHRGGVCRTDDGGLSWQPFGPEGRLIMSVAASPSEPDVVWVGTGPSEVCRSADGGDTWQKTSDLVTLPSSSTTDGMTVQT